MRFTSIFNQVKTERDNLKSQMIEIVPGYTFNQYQTLQRIELYYNGRFEKGPTDPEGFDKYFHNVTKPVVLVAEKAIDLDTKDIRPIADDDTSDLGVWFLGKETKQYLRDTKFAGFLNTMGNSFPKYGSIVSKKVGGVHSPLILHTLINDPKAESLMDSSYITEEHDYNLADIVQLSKDMPDWDQTVLNALSYQIMDGMNQSTVKIYETRHLGPKWWFTNNFTQADMDEIVWGFAVLADIDTVLKIETDEKGQALAQPKYEAGGTYLFKSLVDDRDVYQERHWEKIPGRWLGVGQAEVAFDPQVRQNELSNLKAKALWWKSKQVLVTADEIIARNFMTDVQNGEVVTSKNGISAIQWSNTDLVAYTSEEQRWDKVLRELTFTFDAQIGETMPSGTPYSSTALLASKSGEFFAKKREEFGLFIRDIMIDSVIPEMMKEKKDEHTFNFSDEEADDKKHLIDLAVSVEAEAQLEKMYAEHGVIPSEQEVTTEIENAKQRLASRKGFYTKLRKDFYKDAKYHFDYVVTPEQMDLATDMTTLSNLLMTIGRNPQILQDPHAGALLRAIMKKAGVSPTSLGFDKQMTQAVQPPQGGVPGGAPQAPQMPPGMPQSQMNA